MKIKNLSLSLSLLVLTVSFSSVAKLQTEAEVLRSTAVTFNPLGILLNQAGGKWAFKVSNKVALTVPFTFHYWGVIGGWADSVGSWGGSTGLGAKIFLSDEAMKTGWFIEPNVQLGYSLWNVTQNSLFVSPCANGGYGWVFDSGFSINLALGVCVNVRSVFGDPRTLGTGPKTIVYPSPDWEASLGYAW